jgi:hypothetical protein
MGGRRRGGGALRSNGCYHEVVGTIHKLALVIGGSAGRGALVGGKKGAGISAATGGIGGLIYDLATK